MKPILWLAAATFATLAATGQAESVYKLKDASGATVYSDRPNLPGTTQAGTVELAPGPSAEQQQAADERMRQMGSDADRLRQSRLDREHERQTETTRSSGTVEEVESSAVGLADRRRWRDPKRRIPVESPQGGEHPIYEPGRGPPVHAIPRVPAGRR